MTAQLISLEPEEVTFAFTQAKRREIVAGLMENGQLPKDQKDVALVLSTLKDMDSQAIGRKRIKVEEKNNDVQAGAAVLIAKVLSETHGMQMMPRNIIRESLPELPELPEIEVVPGEMDQNPGQLDFDSFMKTMKRDVDED